MTANEIETAVNSAGITQIDHHDCGFCGYMTAYMIDNGEVYFDPGCHCIGNTGWRRSSFQDLADWYNMQSNDEVRARLREAFGMADAR